MVNFDGLRDFNVSELLTGATGQALELPVDQIDVDPDNIRRACDAEQLAALAETIGAIGLIQPISVRHHPTLPGRYLVNAGERRLRAVRLLGRATIAAFIKNEFDPYGQAIENLQREEIHPLDLARFIAAREAAGDTRAMIAKRLGKPKSFISEVAALARAPEALRCAFSDGRIPDTRTAYLLARHYAESPATVSAWLAADAPLTRESVTRALAAATGGAETPANLKATTAKPPRVPPSPTWNALAVRVGTRPGRMSLKPGESATSATVEFADGSQEAVALCKITVHEWTTL
jgi:ParB family chromosome partitioning protein